MVWADLRYRVRYKKSPLTLEGISLAPRIKEFGAKILMTACYEPKQMITACALKADYVVPYFAE